MVLAAIEKQYGTLVNDLAKKLNINPSWLYVVIFNESSWNPEAVNKFTDAYGLFQFMPSTLQSLGYSRYVNKVIPVEDQFNIAHEFLKGRKSQYKDLYQFYLSVFYPYAINKPMDFILGSEVSPARVALIAKQNPAMSLGKNHITVQDVARYIYYKSQYLGFNVAKDFLWKLLNRR